jgi:beta-phosphoglucomutase-like phosphatase (HAD superfamily)
VSRAKPYPDPYLAAARQLRLDPRQCAVIENAPLGIEAARNAGMYCIAVQTTLGKEYLSAADCILQDINELLTLPILHSPTESV